MTPTEMASFDPRLSAEWQRNRPLHRMGKLWSQEPESYFGGQWEQRNVLNSPGPFYGADTDTCWDGPGYAPASLLCDALGQGFVWRQPRTDDETCALMTGASSDPFGGFAWDGDQHWTPCLVRDWWASRGERAPLVSSLIEGLGKPDWMVDLPTRVGLATEYRRYLEAGLEQDLRRYIYFLEAGRYPHGPEALPHL